MSNDGFHNFMSKVLAKDLMRLGGLAKRFPPCSLENCGATATDTLSGRCDCGYREIEPLIDELEEKYDIRF